MLTVGSLFSGIGGFDLGLERTGGFAVRWQVEMDKHCTRVLKHHWPEVARYGDITKLDPQELEPVDLVCGGFPCQPVSCAGRRRGQEDERWLWPEFAKVLRVVRPRYVLIENTPGLLSANGGRAFEEVLGDLAALGYDAEWCLLGAWQIGAPHRRDRVFVVAYANGDRRRFWPGEPECQPRRGRETDAGETGQDMADPAGIGRREGRAEPEGLVRCSGPGVDGDMADAERDRLQGTEHPGTRQGAPGMRRRPADETCATMADADDGGRDGRAGQLGQGRRGEPADGGPGSVVPGLDGIAYGVSAQLDTPLREPPYCDTLGAGGRQNAHAPQARAAETLPVLRGSPGTEELQWAPRGTGQLHEAQVLRPAVLRELLKEGASDSCGSPEAGESFARGRMPSLRGNDESGRSPCGREPGEQCSPEPDDLVRFLSYPMALGAWEEIAQTSVGLHVLRSACAAIGYVPEALSTLQEIWLALSDQEKAWVAWVCLGRGTPWPARPGQPQFPYEPLRIARKVPERVARLKALGNAVVPQVAEWLGRRILEFERGDAG